MGTISLILGVILFYAAFVALWKAIRPSRKNPNHIDTEMYGDEE